MKSNFTFLVIVLSLTIAGLFFNYIVWFRFDIYLKWIKVINAGYKRAGLSWIAFSESLLSSSTYKWYVRFAFLIGLLLLALLATMFLLS